MKPKHSYIYIVDNVVSLINLLSRTKPILGLLQVLYFVPPSWIPPFDPSCSIPQAVTIATKIQKLNQNHHKPTTKG